MKVKGKLFWKKRWFSICSMHMDHDENCNMCKAGNWTNVWKWKIGGLISVVFPRVWIWWMNR